MTMMGAFVGRERKDGGMEEKAGQQGVIDDGIGTGAR